jgi:hypothetical protein
MKLDALVLKRLDELMTRGDSILERKEFDFASQEGKKYFLVSSPEVIGWGTSVLNLLQRAFGESSTHFKRFEQHFNDYDTLESSFKGLQAILAAAKEDYGGGYLFNLRGLVKAEVLSDATEQADALLTAGYKDPACVVAGVALEAAIKEIAIRNGLALGKLDKMNAELCKAGIYNLAKQKQVTAWADLRNKAAHGDWATCNGADVRDMLSGVERFIADYL